MSNINFEKSINKISLYIKKNYDKFKESSIDDKKLILIATGDFGGEYGYGSSDLQSYGIDKDGKLFWAYASGCSCYCGTGLEEKTVKMFEVESFPLKKSLEESINLFNKDKDEFVNSIQSYHYREY